MNINNDTDKYNFVKHFTTRKNAPRKWKLYKLFEYELWDRVYDADRFVVKDARDMIQDIYNDKIFVEHILPRINIGEIYWYFCDIQLLQNIIKHKNYEEFLSHREWIIYSEIPPSILRSSFENFGDKNYLTCEIIWSYHITNNQSSIFAKPISIDMIWFGYNYENNIDYISPDDVIEFILKYPKFEVSINDHINDKINVIKAAFFENFGIDYDNAKRFLSKYIYNLQKNIKEQKNVELIEIPF